MDTIELKVRVPASTMKIIAEAAAEHRTVVDEFVVLGAYRYAVSTRSAPAPDLDIEGSTHAEPPSLEPA